MSLENISSIAENDEDAIELYKRGVEFEIDGYLDDAVEMYKKALKINPNAEKIYNEFFAKSSVCEKNDLENDSNQIEPDNSATAGFNILELPETILLMIFEKIITIDLDYCFLGRLAMVCKKFYHVSKSGLLWKSVAMQMFSNRQTSCLQNLTPKPLLPIGCLSDFYGFKSWRDLVLSNPHLLFNGIYASKIEYDHRGGPSVDPRTNALCPSRNSIVRYFRIIRFFNDGFVHMITTPMSLKSAINLASSATAQNLAFDTLLFLRFHPSSGQINQLPDGSTTYMVGSYQFDQENNVHCKFVKLEKFIPRQPINQRQFRPLSSQTIQIDYIIKFKIASAGKSGLYRKLKWSDYTIERLNCHTKASSKTSIDITTNHFKPLFYYRIEHFGDPNFPFIDGLSI